MRYLGFLLNCSAKIWLILSRNIHSWSLTANRSLIGDECKTLLYWFYIIFLIQSHQQKKRLCIVHSMSTFIVDFLLVSTAIQRLYSILMWILISKLRVLSSCHLIPYQALDQISEIRFPFRPTCCWKKSTSMSVGRTWLVDPGTPSSNLETQSLLFEPNWIPLRSPPWVIAPGVLSWLLPCLSHICSWESSRLPACCC